jgi:hypothetical protein
MAIHTKFGEKVTNESLRVDQDCVFDDEIIKVWAKLEGQTDEKQYWISDLIGDSKKEVRDVINSNLKKRERAN